MYKFLVSILILVAAFSAPISALPHHSRLWPSRIVGGQPAYRGQFPYQVSLRYWGSHICGGTIINQNRVVTAAHCVIDPLTGMLVPFISYSILAGANNKNNDESDTQTSSVSQVIVHPEYDSKTMVNDVALLKLTTPLNFANSYVGSIPLCDVIVADGTTSTVSGWGTLKSGGASPDLLYWVNVPVVSDLTCNATYSAQGYPVYSTMICAGQAGKDSCQGDSGGPLVSVVNGQRVLIGIVSWGIGCGEPNYAGVYTEVCWYKTWIENTMKANP